MNTGPDDPYRGCDENREFAATLTDPDDLRLFEAICRYGDHQDLYPDYHRRDPGDCVYYVAEAIAVHHGNEGHPPFSFTLASDPGNTFAGFVVGVSATRLPGSLSLHEYVNNTWDSAARRNATHGCSVALDYAKAIEDAYQRVLRAAREARIVD